MRGASSELTEADFKRAIPGAMRRRLCRGDVRRGKDLTGLRRFVGMTQEEFADAVGIRVGTLHNWERGRRRPRGPALALIRIVARDPRVLRRISSPSSGEGGRPGER
jgi:DNA-binding transcriptional regulator YiaG